MKKLTPYSGSSLNALGRMYSVGSENSAMGGLRMSVSSIYRGRLSSGRPAVQAGTGSRKPTLTMTDLEGVEPFMHLKNIEKPLTTKSASKQDADSETLPTTRVSFTGRSNVVSHVTQDPTSPFVPSRTYVKRSSQEPMTSLIGLPAVTRAAYEPMTSLVPAHADFTGTTHEPVTSAVPEYADVKPASAQLRTTSPTYTTMPGNGTFFLGKIIAHGNYDYSNFYIRRTYMYNLLCICIFVASSGFQKSEQIFFQIQGFFFVQCFECIRF